MIVDLSPRNRWHPDRWSPTSGGIASSARPEAGQIIAWRYATWRVLEVRFPRFAGGLVTWRRWAQAER